LENVTEIFEAFSKLNVMIIGDVMIDRYLQGKVSRISPEAPVPIVEYKGMEDRLGGAANVALNIKALGATPFLFSVIGDDTEGDDFMNLLEQKGMSELGILKDDTRPTTLKMRIVAGTQQLLRVDTEVTKDIDTEIEKKFFKKIHHFLDDVKIDVIIFQDYNKGVLTKNIIQNVLKEANKRQIPTAVDPKKKHFFDYKNVTLFKPNLKEIREAVPFDIKPDATSLAKASSYIEAQLGHQYTMITLSDKGLYLEKCGNNDVNPLYPTQARNIADVSGAGDTVISVAALCLALSLQNNTLALLANLAGGQVCEKAGVVPVDKNLLKQEYEEAMQTNLSFK
jgi:D-glycero-beta-D-manno-heptose-7-phosphate kinase